MTPEPPAFPISRRTVVAGAAWSVPVIVAVTATPAFAATSAAPTTTVTAPRMQAPAAGQVVVTAVVKNSSGVPLAGQAVSFTGPSGTSFSPTTATTDGSGTATSTLTTSDAWALPGSTVTVTALSNGTSGSAPLTVLGANARAVGENTEGFAGVDSADTTVSSATQLLRVFPSPVAAVSAAGGYSLALLHDGTVWSVGINNVGQLGDGTTTSRATWAQIPHLDGVTQVVASYMQAYALLSDGTVRRWGVSDERGGPNGPPSYSTVPIAVSGVSGAKEIAVGFNHAFALLTNGQILAWGQTGNGFTPLGNGSSADSTTPVTVSGISNAIHVAAGYQSGYALLSSGEVRAWGRNDVGQLGNGTTTGTTTPVAVSGITNAVRISTGYTSAYALLSTGRIRGWGFNRYGQLGNGSTSDSVPTPVDVTGISTATAIGSVLHAAYALLADGSVLSWGRNHYGQLGDGTTTDRSTSASLSGAVNTTILGVNSHSANTGYLVVGDRVASFSARTPEAISAGSSAVVVASVTTTDGSALVGQTVAFSAGTTATASPATATTDSSGTASTTITSTDTWATAGSSLTVTANSGGYSTAKILKVLGANAYAVGDNTSGVAGTDDSAGTLTVPTQVSRAFPSPITALASGNGHSLAILSDGTLWAVGNNDSSQLGDGTTTSRTTWAPVPGIANAVSVAASLRGSVVCLADGTVRQWGASLEVDTNTPPVASPTVVAGLTNIVQVSASASAMFARSSDGTLYAWGDNSNGLLGDGFRESYRATAEPVPNLSDVAEVAAGVDTVYARVTNGGVWAWGVNSGGALGNGTVNDDWSYPGVVYVANQGTPGAVTGITNAARIVSGAASGYALLATGEIRAWGANDSGQLGDGTTTDRTTPVAVTSVSTATRIGASYSSAYAITTDGKVLAWGDNSSGQLSNGGTTTTAQTTPTAATTPGPRPVTAFGTRPYWKTMLFIT